MIFVYGSLAAPATIDALLGHPAAPGRDHSRARLDGWALTWNVCTDNTALDPVVSYEDPATGLRPPIQILFLTIDPTPGATVDGLRIALPDTALPALDAREGNYLRTAVTLTDGTPAWTYTAKPASATRARRALAEGTARIRTDYHATVTAAYRAHDLPPLAPPPAPVVPLRRIVR